MHGALHHSSSDHLGATSLQWILLVEDGLKWSVLHFSFIWSLQGEISFGNLTLGMLCSLPKAVLIPLCIFTFVQLVSKQHFVSGISHLRSSVEGKPSLLVLLTLSVPLLFSQSKTGQFGNAVGAERCWIAVGQAMRSCSGINTKH